MKIQKHYVDVSSFICYNNNTIEGCGQHTMLMFGMVLSKDNVINLDNIAIERYL